MAGIRARRPGRAWPAAAAFALLAAAGARDPGGEEPFRLDRILDPARARARALEAEAAGDVARAHAWWGRVLDRTEATRHARREAMEARRRLRKDLPLETTGGRARGWKILNLLLRRLDVRWKDAEGRAHRTRTVLTDGDIATIRASSRAFAGEVQRSSGRLLPEVWTLVIDEPLRRVSGDGRRGFWLGPPDVAEVTERCVRPGQYDSVHVFAKVGPAEAGTDPLPVRMFGGTYGGDYGPKGCGFSAFTFHAAWLRDRSGEVILHEWLHQVDWCASALLGYPEYFVPSADDGRTEGEVGGDPCYRRPRDEPTWLGFYRHILRDHITEAMWEELSIRDPAPTPFSRRYIRRWLVSGPPAEGEEGGEGRSRWRRVTSRAIYVDLYRLFPGLPRAEARACADVRIPRVGEGFVFFGCEASGEVSWNGETVIRASGPRHFIQDVERAHIRFREGWNRLLVKVGRDGGLWRFSVRIGDAEGREISGLECAAPVAPRDPTAERGEGHGPSR